tara:strand:+ start:2672 stop:4945 length:2274 start_codon:yes stop_codon:yes gene_type:complete
MSYTSQAAGTVHNITLELRVASGSAIVGSLSLAQITLSTSKNSSYPIVSFQSVGSELNPLTTHRSLAGVSVEIADTPEVRSLFAPGYIIQTRLKSQVGTEDTTLKIPKGKAAVLLAALGGAYPYNLHIGSETVVVQNGASLAAHDTLTVVRGAGSGNFKTDAIGHVAGSLLGASPQRWVGRLVSEVLVYPNGDEKLVALYACDDVPVYRDGLWMLPLQDGLGFYNRTLGRGMGSAKIASGQDYGQPDLNNQGILIAGDNVAAEDSINPGTYHMNPMGWVGNDKLIFSLTGRGQARGQKITTVDKPDAYFWPFDGRWGRIAERGDFVPGDDIEPRIPLHSTAPNLFLALLTSRKGDITNGSYDVIPGSDLAQTGAGIDISRINVDAFFTMLQGLPDLKITIKPGDLVMDVIERELAVWNLFLDIDEEGLITIRKVRYPFTTQDCDHVLDDTSLYVQASEELRMSGRIVSRATLKTGYDIISEDYKVQFNLPGVQTAENEIGESVVFEPTSYEAPTTVAEMDRVRQTLEAVIALWGVPHPVFVLEHDWTKHLVRIGDTVAVTNPRIPDSLGNLGVSVACLVTATEADLESGLMRITAEAVGVSFGGYICPAGEIVAVTALGGASYQLQFQSAASSRLVSGLKDNAGNAADEAEYFAVGWGVAGRSYDTGLTTWTGQVTAVSGANVTVTASALPIAGEIVSMDAYGTFGSAPSTQPAELGSSPAGNKRPGLVPLTRVAYLWLADANETLGAASDAASEWS